MSWKNLLTTVACFTSCATLHSVPVGNGNDLNMNLKAGTSLITFSGNIDLTAPVLTEPLLFPMGSTTDFAPNANAMTIDGMGNSLNGGSAFRGFFALGTGTLVIQNMTLLNCKAQGGAGGVNGGGGLGAGGALYVGPGTNVTLNNFSIQSCNATGGAGGTVALIGGGGGGGGLTGAGGNPVNGQGGGGGGGFAYPGGTGAGLIGTGGGGGGTGSAGLDGSLGGTGGSNFTPTGGGSGGTVGFCTPGAGGGPGGSPVTGGTGGGGGGGNPCDGSGGAGGFGNTGGGGGGSGGTNDGAGITAPPGGNGNKYSGGGGGGQSTGVVFLNSDTGGAGGLGGFGAGGGGGGLGGITTSASGGGVGGAGGNGGFGAGGGGGGKAQNSGSGSCTGGGGGSSGGFGGAGGTGSCASAGAGGNGASFGGGIFMEAGGTLTLSGSAAFSGNNLVGLGGATQRGIDIFMMNGSNLVFNLSSPITPALANPIESENLANSGGGIIVQGTATVDFATNNLQNTYTGTTTINGTGVLLIASDGNLGSSGTSLANPVTMNATAGNPTLEVQGAVTINAARTISFLGAGTSTFLINTGSLGISGPLALGTGNLAVNTVAAGATCTLSGLISGGASSTLTKLGAGTLTLNGTTPNTYGGLTTVNDGLMNLSSTGDAIVGNMLLNGGILQLLANGQTSNTAIMTIAGGTFAMGNFTTTLESLTFNSGAVTQGVAATLTLSNAGPATALFMQGGTTIPGPVTFSGSGTFLLTGTTGTATLSGSPINLGGGNVTLNTGASTAAVMDISGALSNGSATLTGSGTLQFPNPETIDSFTFNSGTLVQGAGAILTLTDPVTALTMQGGTTIPGSVTLSGSGSVVFTGASGTATINGTVDNTGGNPVTWNIADGSAVIDMQVSGPIIGNGGLTKTGAGLLNLTGASLYVGPTAVNAGVLAVNGSIISNTTVALGATLQGTGTVGGTVDVSGTLSPGNSIGTLTVGSTTMLSTSTYLNEITPTSTDLLMVNGTFTIDPGATFALSPAMAFYDPDSIYKVIQTTNGVSGKFTNFTTTFPFMGQLFYTTNAVFLEVNLGTFGGVLPKGNCHQVAVALDNIFAGGNPMNPIFVSLLGIPLDQLCNTVSQLQPSLFKGMAIVQQNNILAVNNALEYRFQNVLDDMYCSRTVDSNGTLERQECRPDEEFFHIWVDGFGDFSNQKNNHYANSPQIGYHNTTGGVVEGFDFHFADYYYVGALAAATRSHIHWNSHKGKGRITSSYGGLYASAIGTLYYVNTSAMWSWNHYDAHRNIIYPGTNRRAHNKHDGNQFFAHLDTGLNFRVGNFTLRPFDKVDYITQQEHQYKEHGAGAFNLAILGNRLRMVRNELGLNFARCVCLENGTFTVDGKLSWIYEARLKGRKTTSRFQGTTPHFTVISYYKSRSLFSPGLTLSYKNDLYDITAYYDGEFTKKYWDQSVGLQLGFDF